MEREKRTSICDVGPLLRRCRAGYSHYRVGSPRLASDVAMNERLVLLLAAALFASSACTSEESQPVSETDPPTGGGGSGGSGGGGGSVVGGCPPGTTTADDETCVPAGVPADGCGEGFEALDGGCTPILPGDPCGDGLIAVPGETECREVTPCGQGTWGDIPTGPNTQFVDGAYPGMDSDGTEARPWTTVQAGVSAAAAGEVVAVAAGSYDETVIIAAYPVRLIGRCPAMVELATANGNGSDSGIYIDGAAPGTEVRSLAISSPGLGVYVHGAADVLLEDLWIHDTDFWGLHVDSAVKAGSATIRNVLVERALNGGIVVLGAEVTAERVAVRNTRRELGGAASGVTVQDIGDNNRASLTVRDSYIVQSNGVGAYVGGADLVFERTAIVDSRPALGALVSGMGILQQDAPEHPVGTLTLRQTVIETSRYLGIYISGGDATIENSTIRGVTPDPNNGAGHGIGIEDQLETGRPSNVGISRSLVELSTEVGVSVFGSDVTIDATIIRATATTPKVEWFGRGVHIQNGATDPTRRSAVHINDSSIEGNSEAGVLVTISDLWMDHSAITDTLPLPSKGLGDGLLVFGNGGETNAEITNCLIARSARAGVAVFGGNLILESNAIECNPIAIGTEVYQNSEPVLVDDGGNACACDGVEGTCRAQQSSLAPPDAL